MSRWQRIVLLATGLGLFHSSLVPPVRQNDGDLCRYHAFTERGWPFTREFGTGGVDGTALLTEYGIILSLAGIAYVLLGWLGTRHRTATPPTGSAVRPAPETKKYRVTLTLLSVGAGGLASRVEADGRQSTLEDRRRLR